MFDILVGFIFCGIIYLLLQRIRHHNENLPPGPQAWPIVGNLPQMLTNPPEKIREWSKKFGSTISVRLGSQLQVILHDYDTLKSVYSTENTTGRDQNFVLAKLLDGKGFLASEGEVWHQHRRFALSTLRDLGMGKSWLEDAILEEVQEMINIYTATNGTPYNPRPHLTLSVSNVICAMVFGKRFDHSDQKFLHLSGLIGQNVALTTDVLPIQILPILKHLPGKFGSAWKKFATNLRDVLRFIDGLIDQHSKDKDVSHDGEQTDKRDYIDRYLTEIGNEKSSTFNEVEMRYSLANLFAAGTETSTSTLLWCFVYMLENPDVLAKVHSEIDSKIGRDRPIRMQDKSLLSYTDAVLLEVQRLASVIPLGVPHTNLASMTIDGFNIPARTILNSNAYSMHHDPKYWKHPDRFYPEHFLNADGTVFIPKGFIPFGIGKRMCLGESLAKMNIHLFFANVVQKFDIRRAPGSDVSSQKCIIAFGRIPQPFEICFVPR